MSSSPDEAKPGMRRTGKLGTNPSSDIFFPTFLETSFCLGDQYNTIGASWKISGSISAIIREPATQKGEVIFFSSVTNKKGDCFEGKTT